MSGDEPNMDPLTRWAMHGWKWRWERQQRLQRLREAEQACKTLEAATRLRAATDGGKAVPERLTPTQQQIVEIIRGAGRRLATNEILAGLEAANGAASVGTTKQSLAELTRRGVLTNASDFRGKGYGLPEWR